MRLGFCLLLAGAASIAVSARAADAIPVVVFDFNLINTSPADSTPEELARTRHLSELLRAALTKSGKYTVIDSAPAAPALAKYVAIKDCNGCELPIAQTLGAQQAMYGWVQKVSNLILNLNVVIETVPDGKAIGGGSVDIRGNTDESWTRGLNFLVEEHVLNDQ